MKDLPPGWAWTTLGEIADLKGGLAKGKRRRLEDRLRPVPYLRVENVQRGYLNLDVVKLIEATEAEIEDLRLRVGDVLFNEGGDRDKLGRGWVWQGALPECIHQNHVFRARLRASDIQPKFLSFYGNSEGATYFNNQGKQTTNLASINLTKLSEFPVPLPPGCEQRRIVAEIEKQFTRLDAGANYLLQADSRIERLADAAVESEMRVDFTRRPMGDICDVQGGIQKQPKRRPASNAYPFLRVANVLRNRLVLDDIHLIELFPGELERLRLVKGDLLIVEGNGSPSQIGRMAVWDGSIDPCVHQNHIIRARAGSEALPEFVSAYWNSPSGRRAVAAVASSTSGLYTLSVSKINSLLIPVPPMEVQRAIVDRIQRALSFTDRASQDCRSFSTRAARLRQAILKKAFAGKLVPQDPNDEPASVLLERIRATGAQTPARRAPRKRLLSVLSPRG